jgi:ElaB/YqjD/DUF883 family membrane-anchored ribosome-binding protein
MSDTPLTDSPFGTAAAVPPHDPFQAAKASAMKAAEELRAAAVQKAGELRDAVENRAQKLRDTASTATADLKEKSDELRQYADETLKEAGARFADLRAEAERFAREKPVQALAAAFGVGFVLGLILRR